MTNPYQDRPNYAFWKRAVSDLEYEDVDLVTEIPFKISKTDKVATAGSCFAQHIACTLSSTGFNYFVTETFNSQTQSANENFGVFSARFGNIYTTRQLLQLFDRAYGLFASQDDYWFTTDDRLLDPFRPLVQEAGYSTVQSLRLDRESHLMAVRRMFEEADVFIFTLGLTEAWVAKHDGTAFPLAPGVVKAMVPDENYEFHNLTVQEMEDDLGAFLDRLQTLNPAIKVILTVSPVPLIATYEERHVVLSTELSKAALRVVADSVCKTRPNVVYFPSYEIITSHFNPNRFFDPDMRNVSAAGVEKVMGVFRRHLLTDELLASSAPRKKPTKRPAGKSDYSDLARVICDEEAIIQ